MNELLPNLIETLREELKQYGEMLALLDQQQHLVMRRQTDDLLPNVAAINAQADVITAARREREQRQREMARQLNLSAAAGFATITPLLPPEYQPLVQALVEENNELLGRVQQRARQNHLLLSHVVELMQRLIHSLVPGSSPETYNEMGRLPGNGLPQKPFYQAIG
ncbi:MAG TPA: flagellar export chaperone FlgN [Candidatus Sulfopaludibacter sp.]|nr:flagellar export chaperone FlgN [Candidatus Sulfopaludibacter sp.]